MKVLPEALPNPEAICVLKDKSLFSFYSEFATTTLKSLR